MNQPPLVRRAIVVVLDGLRPDAIRRFDLQHLSRLMRRGASTTSAQTVAPSVTAAAMASLLTGATPARHGLRSDRFHLPTPSGPVHPLPRVLAEQSIPSRAFMARVPLLFQGIANRLAGHLGVAEARFHGEGAADILGAARRTIETRQRGLVVLHWPDADRAGHAHGWMSPEYGMAAGALDDALGALLRLVDLDDPSTLLVALADHGGGGVNPRGHDSDSPLDRTIPMVLAGGAIEPGPLPDGVSLLDVPATVAWALGAPLPASYAGRPLVQAFVRSQMAA